MNSRRRGVRWLASVFLLTLSMQVGAAALHQPLSHLFQRGQSGSSDGEHHASSCGLCQLVSQFRAHSGAVPALAIELPDQVVWLVDEHAVAEPAQSVPLGPRSRAPPRSQIA
jgi:hypothetical protein